MLAIELTALRRDSVTASSHRRPEPARPEDLGCGPLLRRGRGVRRRCTARLADYGPTKIVHGVTLDVDAAEIVCLLGRNGVGKSTLVNAVMGLLKQVRARVGDSENR